ncbi:MAG: calcium/sodium antiporter [Chloroflexi bacterium]|nr:calcium/sodium antiporter [Chloroflexota bacterium]
MMLYGFYILLGLIGLVYSADKFVEGASNLARNLGMSAILVGIIIVGIGTSAPEILVSSSAALEGSDLALGNAIGSNISNIGLIIGLTALFVPLTVRRELLKKEFALLIAVTFLGIYLLSDGNLVRLDAFFFLISLAFVMYFFVMNAKHGKHNEPVEEESEITMTMGKSILYTVLGMAALIGFSKLLVFGAVSLAKAMGVDDIIIGLTIVSVGTSLPELSACIAAARQKQADLAIGNIVGSNIFNILAVLSASGFIHPMEVKQEMLVRDLPLMGILTIGFLLVSFSPKGDGKINRVDGFLFLTIFVLYITSLVLEEKGIFDTTKFLMEVM